MKSLFVLSAAVAALLVAGCKSSTTEADGMMSGKNGGTVSQKKEGQCPFEAAAKKDDCCASEAKATDAKKSGCCAEGKTEATTKTGCCADKSEVKADAKKDGCCPEGKSEAKAVTVKDGCCKGKEVSVACADCKKACEAAGGCDAGKKCDEKPCEEKPKP